MRINDTAPAPPWPTTDQVIAALGEAPEGRPAMGADRPPQPGPRQLGPDQGLPGGFLGLEEEYRDQHGYEPQLVRSFAVGEVLQGEQARGEVPVPWWRELDSPQPPLLDRPAGADRAGWPPGQGPDLGGRR